MFSPRTLLTLIPMLLAATLMLFVGCAEQDALGYETDPGYYGDNAVNVDEQGTPARDDDYGEFDENEFVDASEDDTSTFASDVSTASYTLMRRDIAAGRLPDPAGVRIEEYINFFDYDYAPPKDDDLFSVHTEVAPSDFGSTDDQTRHLMQLGVQAEQISIDEMKPTNLVFLVDVSGSMSPEDRLPLAQDALHTMLEYLRDDDTVGIQTYASGSESVLDPTPVENRSDIEEAIDSLEAAGSTFGEGGITDAYAMAEEAFIEGGNNRVIILTDGDFNVGKTGDDLIEMVKDYRDEHHISLTSAGFGHGGYNDATMERLARKGNGNYFYVDTEREAHRIFGSELPSTIQVLAHDVRNQVIFNDEVVNQYRLIGYEKRLMDDDDFDDADADGGEIGPGHDVTAFYELELHDDLNEDAHIATARVAHKTGYDSELIEERHVVPTDAIVDDFSDASGDFQFSAAVAQYAGILRESEFVYDDDFEQVISVAEEHTDGDDARIEFLELVGSASNLW